MGQANGRNKKALNTEVSKKAVGGMASIGFPF